MKSQKPCGMLIEKKINVNIFYDENDVKMDEMDETDDSGGIPRTPAIIVFSPSHNYSTYVFLFV